MPQAYSPTISDVFAVRGFFSSKPASFPVEIIDFVLDHAEYWPYSTTEVKGISIAHGGFGGHSHGGESDKIYLRTLPLAHPNTEGEHTASPGEDAVVHPLQDGEIEAGDNGRKGATRGKHPCRRIVFELLSRDQGWSWDRAYHGTYKHSWTWLDVTVERAAESEGAGSDVVEHALLPKDTHLQRNIHAQGEYVRHVVTWDWQDWVEKDSVKALKADHMGRGWRSLDGEFVRGLQYGDRFVLWMHARFPGWACYLSEAKVTVYWAV